MKSLYELSNQYQQLQEVDCDLIGDTLDAAAKFVGVSGCSVVKGNAGLKKYHE